MLIKRFSEAPRDAAPTDPGGNAVRLADFETGGPHFVGLGGRDGMAGPIGSVTGPDSGAREIPNEGNDGATIIASMPDPEKI